MQAVYAERLDALQQAIESSGAPLRLRPVHSGLHAVADLEGVDAARVFQAAVARKVETMPLSYYYFSGDRNGHDGAKGDERGELGGGGDYQNALLLGFRAVPPGVIRAKMASLAAAIDDARGKGAPRAPRSG